MAKNHLQQWIDIVNSELQQYGVNLLTQGVALKPEGDQRATEGYLVVRTEQPPVSVVLGTRNREDGGGREAFFCLVNGTWQDMGKELVTISYDGDLYKMVDARGEIWAKPSETNKLGRSLTWVRAALQAP